MDSPAPKPIVVDLVFRGASGKSLAGAQPGLRPADLRDYAAGEETQREAEAALRELGFAIVGPPSPFGVSVSGSPERVREVFGEGELKVPPRLAQWIASARIPPPGQFLP